MLLKAIAAPTPPGSPLCVIGVNANAVALTWKLASLTAVT